MPDYALEALPELGEGDLFAWNFYQANATGFVQDFALMPQLLSDLNPDEGSKSLLLRKLGLIHASVLKIQRKEIEDKHGRR